MGFDGKQCIHPAQLPIVNDVFSPSDGEVCRRQAIVDACARAEALGQGAAVHDGRMIDAASLRMARTILDRARPRLDPRRDIGGASYSRADNSKGLAFALAFAQLLHSI